MAKFHMRMVVSGLVGLPDGLDKDVCIDVVLRGEVADIDKIMPTMRASLDCGEYLGNWAGIGRGDYVDRDVTIG